MEKYQYLYQELRKAALNSILTTAGAHRETRQQINLSGVDQ
jgi:hypothetical protein